MSNMSSTMSTGKGKGKGKAKPAGTAAAASSPQHHDPTAAAGSPEAMPTIVPCAPYLPALQHVPDHTLAHSHRLAIHTLTSAVRAQDPATFARIAHHGNLLEFIETYLRFRPPYPAASTSPATDRALDVLTFSWFRKLTAYLATPAAMTGAPGMLVTETVLDHVSALMVLDFCKWYGHCMPAAGRIVADLVQARPMLVAEIEDVVRVCSHLMGKQVTAHMGGTSPTQINSPGGDGPVDPLVVADALATFKSLVRVLPASVSASAFDDAFLSTLAGFFEAVLVPGTDARTLVLATGLAMDVIRCRFLVEASNESIGHLATLLHMMMDLAHAQHADKKVDGSLIAALAVDTSLVDDLKSVDAEMFHGDTSIVAQLDNLRTEVLEHRSAQKAMSSPKATIPADPSASVMDDPDTAVAITQVLDLFPDMSAVAVRHLLLQSSNDTAKLIDALLMDESLRAFQPPAAPAAAPEPAAPVVDEALLASVRERFAHVEDFAAAKQVSGRSMVKESKSAAKRKVLALAARIAAEDEEEAHWDDEYDDTYDSVDVRVADGTAEEEVEAGTGARNSGAATANNKRSNVGSEAMVNDPAAKFEEDLFRAWSASPAVFERSGKRLPERARLRERTGMSDQQIEGWASMMRRTPARVRHLQNRYQFSGNRAEVLSAQSAGGGVRGEQDGEQRPQHQQRNAEPTRRDGQQFNSGRGGSAGRGASTGRGRGRGGAQASAGSGASGDSESGHDSAQPGVGRGRGGGSGGGQRGGRGGRDVRAERVKAHWKKTKDMA